jgi:hypothetical protein
VKKNTKRYINIFLKLLEVMDFVLLVEEEFATDFIVFVGGGAHYASFLKRLPWLRWPTLQNKKNKALILPATTERLRKVITLENEVKYKCL